MTHKEQEEGI